MNESRTLSWFSCGAASAVATALTPEALPIYCETGSEHPENEKFLKDCEAWFGRPVTRIRSEDYADTWDLWNRRKWLAGPKGAACTTELKVAPRLAFQRPYDRHVFGYTADSADVRRANLFVSNYPELSVSFPLIERGITKAACLAMVENVGIKLPPLYALGFQNNNCIPCVKATSPDYWALVRAKFPDQFSRMVELSRRLGVRLARMGEERIFIDEIPPDWPTTSPIQPSCDFLCAIAEAELNPKEPKNAKP